jgi:RES domain-containing protein
VIYAAATRALCALEVLANANELGGDYIVTPIDLPDDIGITSISIDTLPLGWDAAQPTTETADIGTGWAERLETVVLLVPSAIIAREHPAARSRRVAEVPATAAWPMITRG